MELTKEEILLMIHSLQDLEQYLSMSIHGGLIIEQHNLLEVLKHIYKTM